MKWVMIILAALVIAAIVGVIFVRTASHESAAWHVDPATVTEIDDRNQFLGAETFPAEPAKLATALETALGGELLAGDLADGWATYVVKTPLIGFPDYISVRLADAESGSKLTLYSRSRFGQSDLGANKARVERIFTDLKAALTDT